jgi:golgin subfamily B member 1
MDSQTIRTLLGKIQAEPDSDASYQELADALKEPGGDLSQDELFRLLDAAGDKHAQRGEWTAVAALLEIAVAAAQGTPREVDLIKRQAKVLKEELFDEDGAQIAYIQLMELVPDDSEASAAMEESESKRTRYPDMLKSYLEEAEGAQDEVYKSSMLMRAAEMDLRFATAEGDRAPAVERLEKAVRLDPTNERAAQMLEVYYRKHERWEDLERTLERLSDRADKPATRVSAGIRLARAFAQHLNDSERAARAYERVLKDSPEHPEALDYLIELYSSSERWADLCALYEKQLAPKNLGDPALFGDMLQVAMLYYRKLDRARDAEPWFGRILKLEPTAEVALNFYREYCKANDDEGHLVDILQAAQRALPDTSKEKAQLSREIAKLAEGQANAQKAIEQYKSILRNEPDNVEARDKLKVFYRQTQSYNALVELLRQELDRTPAEQFNERLAVLREIAGIYRENIKSDTALLSILNQIIVLDEKLDEHDIEELRELIGLYEKLNRWRDVITYQLKLAEVTPDVEEKKTLFRAAARRWLEQFSNAQNAAEAYASLLKVAPDDQEARERLEEIYRKRRAWPALYELFSSQVEQLEGAAKIPVLSELAQLAAERLNKGPDAVALYRQILDLDPSRQDVLDAFEKQAERAKDWPSLADALERRIATLTDETARLAALQKLGTVYADHVNDPAAAARAWRRVLELQPGHHRALRVLRDSYLSSADYDGLEQLYGEQNDWEGLAEVFSSAADRAKDNAAKIELSYRAAGVYEQRLSQPDRAFRSYERILSADPSDVRAARALIPLYQKDEKWARLPSLYELIIEKADSVDEKLEMLGQLVEIASKRLSDRRGAAIYARRAYELAPESTMALDLLEEACRAAGNWDPLVEALSARLAALPLSEPPPPPAAEPSGKKKKKKKGAAAEEAPAQSASGSPQRRLLELKLARVYAEELGRVEEAITLYRRVLERDATEIEAAASLELILRRLDRRDDLRWLLDLRVENAPGDLERVQVLGEWATLEEDVFEMPERAVELYRRILEIEATDERALKALSRLLLQAGDAAGAVEVLERHRELLSGDARAEREAELAELYLTRLNRHEDAFRSAVDALPSESSAPRAVQVLEALLQIPGVRGKAAEVLNSRYAEGGDSRREAQSLTVLLDETRDPRERLAIFTRLCDVYEEKLKSYGSALDTLLKALREFPTDLALWDRGEALSVLAGRPTDLGEAFRELLHGELPPDIEGELCERAARLHEDKLGDPIGATPYLERVLVLNPANEAAFRRLKDILTGAERWSELEALYDRATAATDDVGRRVEMLAEVALICEEIIEDPDKATRYYERILKIDTLHEQSVRALDRLYTRAGKNKELADLLEKRLEAAVGDEAFEIKLRLAKLELDLLEPDRAIVHVEDVLRERVNDHDARTLAERMLEIGTLRPRAARMLEAVYESRDEVRELVRVLAIRLESLAEEEDTEEERRDLLRRMAQLQNQRMHDDEGAFVSLSKLVPLDPLDSDSRNELLAIAERRSAWEPVTSVLTAAAERADTAGLKGEILTRVALIYQERLHDREKAERVYRKVLELDPTDAELVLPAARSLERIYEQSSEHQRLAEMLRVQVKFEQDGNVRRELLGRLGELSRSLLGDNTAAIEAWRLRLDEQPDDETALAALDRLYEQTEQHRQLVDVLERRRELTSDDTLRRELSARRADVLWKRLNEVDEAILAYQSLVADFGPNAESLVALESLFHTAERWMDLGDTYEQHLEIVQSDAERLDLLAKLGDIKREHLNDVPAALEVYRRALSLDTQHGPSRAALEKLLESTDTQARREAAQLLHPLYEADSQYDRLLRAIEIEIETADDTLDKLEGLQAALRVAENSLSDSKRAFGYAERGVRTALGHADLAPWFAHMERLSAATGKQGEYVKLLSEVVDSIFDGELQLSVTLRIADMAKDELGDRELAKTYYRKALELRSDDRRALMALEGLYEQGGAAASLLEILERRGEAAESDAERKTLMFRRAKLLSETLEDKPRAIGVYEQILDMGLDREAISSLETLYTQAEQWSDLVRLYERQLDENPSAAADLRVKVASVAAHKQSDFERAFEELEHALNEDRQHAGAVSELERLLAGAPEPELRARAAALLEPVYLVRADYNKVMETLQARLAVASDPDVKRELLQRLAQLYEEQKEDYQSALETIAKLYHEDLSDEGTVSELERLARVAGAEKRLAEIYAAELEQVSGDDPTTAKLARRTGELFDRLGNGDKALLFYRRALAFEPDSRELFRAVDAILQRGNQAEERVELYRAALDHRFEPSERLELFHTIAHLQQTALKSPDDAIQTYREAVEVDERDARALDALTELYQQRERFDDLGELYLRRAEQAESPTAGAPYRLALARLYKKLGQLERSVDQLETLVSEVPSQRDAVTELEALRDHPDLKERVVEILRPLYESADDWRRLIQLNEDRFSLAEDSEKVAVLRETAELWETRGNDTVRARRALQAAVRLDPEDASLRTDYERLVGGTKSWNELAETYEDVLEERPDLGSKRDVLGVLAKVHDEQRDDLRAALSAYDRLHQDDPSDLDSVKAIERLSMLLSDWPALVRVLVDKADLVLEDAERASIWRQVGEVRRDMLSETEAAINAYEKAAELEPESTATVDFLIALYEQKGDPARLVDLYQRRVELAGDSEVDLKYDLLLAAAKRYEEELGDRPKAIESLNQALGAKPGDRPAIAALNRLFRAESMWAELLDNLKLEAGMAETAAERGRLRKEIGGVLADKLESYEDALEAYRQALEEAPEDVEASDKVRAIGKEHEELRRPVADILVPVLEKAGRHDALVDALELRLTAEAEPADRTATLVNIAEVLEQKLGNPDDALSALLRALVERPESAQLHTDIERLAAAAKGGWKRYADALAERAGGTFDAELARELFVRLGKVAEERLEDHERAVEGYERAVEQAGDQPELLEALDRLYGRIEKFEKVAETIERRVAVEPSGDKQAELYHRLGALQIEKFEDPARGLASLRQALERVPMHEGAVEALEKLTEDRDLFEEAAEVLEGVYRQQNRTDRLAKLYEKRVGFAASPELRLEMRRNLARVLEDESNDKAAAQRVLQQGLAEAPNEPVLLDEIERLAPLTGNWEAAAAALREAIEKNQKSLLPDVAVPLTLRLAGWLRDKAEDRAGAEQALIKGLEFDPTNDELLEQLEQLQRSAGREKELFETLRRRGKLQSDPTRREELYKQAKALADATGDSTAAESLLRELLGQDDGNAWALAELARLRESAGDYKESFKLVVKLADLVADSGEVRELRRRAALLARDRLEDKPAAIELFERIFEDDPSAGDAAQALRDLYPGEERWGELGGLLERLTELATSPDQRSALRIEHAALQAERFKAPDRAIELLRAVLEEQPDHTQAVVSLSELLESSGRDEELAELLAAQIEAANRRGDLPSELTYQVRLGEVYEGRLKNREKAIETYRGVLARDANHRGALESLASLYKASKDLGQAAEVTDRLLTMSQGEQAVSLALELADLQLELKAPEQAAAALERGLLADAGNTTLRDRLRKLYDSTQSWEKLAALIAQDAELTSDTDEKVTLLRKAAQIHGSKRKDHAAAAALLDRASQLKPDDRELLLELCDEYSASGRGKQAAEVLQKIVDSYGGKRSKELAEIHRRLASAYLADGDAAHAAEELDKAFRIEPGNIGVLAMLGEVALQVADYKKAQQMYRALLLQKFDEAGPIRKAMVFVRLGDVHDKLGEKPKAIQMYERAVQTDDKLEEARQKLDALKNA